MFGRTGESLGRVSPEGDSLSGSTSGGGVRGKSIRGMYDNVADAPFSVSIADHPPYCAIPYAVRFCLPRAGVLKLG